MGGDDFLLRAWLDGDLDEDDRVRFEAWLKADEANLRLLVLSSAMEAQLDQLVTDRVGTDAATADHPVVGEELGEELIEAYLGGDLPTVELVRLQRYLQCDVHRQRKLVLDAAFEYDLAQQVSARVESERYEPSTDQTPLRLPSNGMPLSDIRARQRWVGVVSYAAAGVLLAAALLLWVLVPPQDEVPPVQPPSGAVVATAPEDRPATIGESAAEPSVRGARLAATDSRLVRAGETRLLAGSVALEPGDRVLVGERGQGELALADGSRIILGPGTVLGWQGALETSLELAHGTLEVAAAAQPPGSPLRIRTADATATVVGTVFALSADGERTLLSVREGEVALDRGDQRLAVGAGASAAADATGLHLVERRSNWLGAELPPIAAGDASLLPFVDLMRYARPWSAHHDDTVPEERRQRIAVDADGWVARLEPGQHASTVILHGGDYPAGVYTCLYEGDGLIEFGYGANVIRSERGRLEVDVTPTPHGLLLHLVETDPADPVRDIRLVMPGFEQAHVHDPFNPRFVDALRGVGVLRAHRWLEARTGEWLSWADRRRSGAGPGLDRAREAVALEDLLDLVERLDCDLWLTAPHNASDDWFAGLGDLLAQRFDPDRRLYLEYSSEIWNGLFPRVEWCREQGHARGYRGREAAIFFANDRSEALWQAVGSRLGPAHELVRVLSFHDVDYFRDHQQAHGRAFELADALAIYGGVSGSFERDFDLETLAAADRSRLLAALRERARRGIEEIADAARYARRYGKRVLAYRAGIMLWADGGLGIESHHPVSKRAGAIGSDPAAADLLAAWLRAWRRSIGDVATVPLGGDYARALRDDTPGFEHWSRSPTGPSWWALERELEPVVPFPPSVPAPAADDAGVADF